MILCNSYSLFGDGGKGGSTFSLGPAERGRGGSGDTLFAGRPSFFIVRHAFIERLYVCPGGQLYFPDAALRPRFFAVRHAFIVRLYVSPGGHFGISITCVNLHCGSLRRAATTLQCTAGLQGAVVCLAGRASNDVC